MTDPKAKATAAPDPASDPKWNAAAIAAIMGCDGGFQPSRMGAGLLLAHLYVERGVARVRQMSPQELREVPVEMMRRMPMISPSLLSGHAAQFCNVLAMYGLEHESVEHYEREIVRMAPVTGVPAFLPPVERAAG